MLWIALTLVSWGIILGLLWYLYRQRQLMQRLLSDVKQVSEGCWFGNCHQLLHQERLSTIGNMAAAMAHEINNPIAGIVMNLSYLSDVTESEEYHDVVNETLAEVSRVGRLVKSMLSFSRTSDGQSKPFDLHSVVADTLTMLEPLTKTSGIFLQNDTLASLEGLKVCGDADNLKQVLLNLVTNSVQAMNQADLSQKQIVLSVLKHSVERVVLTVSDTGTGIPLDIQDKIFDPFFTTKPQGEGTGLGLAICLKLMEDLGGSLSLDKQYQQGARFLITIPLLTDPSAEIQNTPNTADAQLTLYELSLAKALASAKQNT